MRAVAGELFVLVFASVVWSRPVGKSTYDCKTVYWLPLKWDHAAEPSDGTLTPLRS